MAVEHRIETTNSRLYNPSIEVGDTVFAQDLVDDEMGFPVQTYHTGIYQVMGTIPKEGRLDVILRDLSDGQKEKAVDLSKLMEHGIVGGERLTVIR